MGISPISRHLSAALRPRPAPDRHPPEFAPLSVNPSFSVYALSVHPLSVHAQRQGDDEQRESEDCSDPPRTPRTS